MPSEYIPRKELLKLISDIETRIKYEPLEWFSYDIFTSKLSLRYRVSINYIKKLLEPYFLIEDLIFKDNTKSLFRSELAILLEKERKAKDLEEQIRIQKELDLSPKTKEEVKDFLKGSKIDKEGL